MFVIQTKHETLYGAGNLTMGLNSTRSDTDNAIIRHKDQIYSRIKTDIIRCVLEPGSAISEAKLADRYKVGKAPVRDALARLRHEKLVISEPRKGHTIAPITIRDVIDLYEVRVALEPVAARMAAGKVDEAVLRPIANACEKPISNNDPASISDFIGSNSEFHRAIARFSGNRRLADQISNLLDETDRVRHIMVGSVKSRTETIAEHGELVDCLVSGDREAAASLTKSHIQRGWKMVLSSLLTQFQFMDLDIGGPLQEIDVKNLTKDVDDTRILTLINNNESK